MSSWYQTLPISKTSWILKVFLNRIFMQPTTGRKYLQRGQFHESDTLGINLYKLSDLSYITWVQRSLSLSCQLGRRVKICMKVCSKGNKKMVTHKESAPKRFSTSFSECLVYWALARIPWFLMKLQIIRWTSWKSYITETLMRNQGSGQYGF